MKCNREVCILAILICGILIAPHRSTAQQDGASDNARTKSEQNRRDDAPVDPAVLRNPVLWHDPGRISSLDLYDGLGGMDGKPALPLTFESEDKQGTNPKFDVLDAKGRKWRVKLGDEARPEVTASRLLWAMGFFVEDDYLLASAEVKNLHLQRGAKLARHGHISDARFARRPEGQKKIGIWKWYENPFVGKREFNGLRVMMAVMNNWDLKDVNNAVLVDEESGGDLFEVSDIGATFGTNGLSWTKSRSKGNVDSFERSKFISHQTATEVDFATPKAPTAVLFETAGASAKEFAMRRNLEWIGDKIPIADARWMGSLLKQLSHGQLVDAFRAGHFPPDEIEKYVVIVEARINELAAL